MKIKFYRKLILIKKIASSIFGVEPESKFELDQRLKVVNGMEKSFMAESMEDRLFMMKSLHDQVIKNSIKEQKDLKDLVDKRGELLDEYIKKSYNNEV